MVVTSVTVIRNITQKKHHRAECESEHLVEGCAQLKAQSPPGRRTTCRRARLHHPCILRDDASFGTLVLAILHRSFGVFRSREYITAEHYRGKRRHRWSGGLW